MLRFAIEKGTIVSVAILVMCLFGLVAMFKVPIQMTPDMEAPMISIRTVWPGATPQEVESEIIIEQEEFLRRLQGLEKMTAEARAGTATIDLEFTLETDMQDALIRVNNALSQVTSYPENVKQPRINTSSSTQDPFIFYSIRSADPDTPIPHRAELTELFENTITTELERVPGVAEVASYGLVQHQVRIYVDPAKLAARQITISELRNAIRQRNRDVSGGDLEAGKRRYMIRTVGRYRDLDEIENTIIAEQNGNFIYLKDVAEITLASEEMRNLSYVNGKEAFLFSIKRSAGSNVIEILDGLTERIAILNEGVLQEQGLYIRKNADDVQYVKDAISVVQKNLLLGGLLACLILFLFLHAAAPTLLGTLGVPICCIGAFLGLLLTGRTLNVISLAGIAFAIGMTLDNSIVVIENIFRHRAMGKNHYRAALDGVSEVWTAVLASTLTTVFVFTPIVLIQEEAGQLYSDIAIAISFAILMSMFIAVTAIPSAMSRLPDSVDPQRHQGGLFKPAIAFAGLIRGFVEGIVHWILARQHHALATVLATLGLSIFVVLQLLPRAEYLPEGEESKIFAMMIPPPGYSLSEMQRASDGVDQLAAQSTKALPGEQKQPNTSTLPELDYFIRIVMPNRMFSVSAPIEDGPEQVEALKAGLIEEMRKEPGMITFANRGSIFSGNTGGSRSIQLDIYGPDLQQVYQAAMQTFLQAKKVFPEAQIRPQPGLTLSQPSIEIRPDWQRASELGFNAQDLGYMIWVLSDGAYVDEYFLNDKKIDIYLFGHQANQQSPEDLAQLPVYTQQGGIVPLAALASIEETVSAETIRRVDARRTVTLSIVPPRSIPLETAVEQVELDILQALKNSGNMPAGTRIELAGASDKLKATQAALSDNLILAVALSYLLMVAIFSHWGYPLLILLTIPLGISGGIFGLWFMNQVVGISMPLDMITLLGMVVLIGTVVNNPILLVEQARAGIAQGKAVNEAISDAVRIRLRPIMMSMLTTIFGLSPVVFFAGAGTELYRGLGAIVLFGLFFATLLTLTFIPALLSLILKRNPPATTTKT